MRRRRQPGNDAGVLRWAATDPAKNLTVGLGYCFAGGGIGYTPGMSEIPNVNVTLESDIEQMLAQCGVLLTKPRRVIANALLAHHQHVTAEQLYDQIRQSGHKVSRATIYNTLGLFAQKGLIRPIYIDAASTFYDSNTSHHHHFFNVDSGKLIDMKENMLPDTLAASLPPGTELETIDLVFRIRDKRR
jgi:Fur family iron response transcriptional regulator